MCEKRGKHYGLAHWIGIILSVFVAGVILVGLVMGPGP